MSSKHLQEFLNLRCAGDVLNVVNPIGNKANKEITESIAVMRQVRKIALAKPNFYSLYDFCAGNALTSVLSLFVLPIRFSMAIDIKKRERHWDLARNFIYNNQDIFNFDPKTVESNSIIIAVHACGKLANRVIEIYKESNASHLILMPCCTGEYNYGKYPAIIKTRLGSYLLWCLSLSESVNGKLIVDNHCLSPKNAIIVAEK